MFGVSHKWLTLTSALLLCGCITAPWEQWKPARANDDTVQLCYVTGSRIPQARRPGDCRNVRRTELKQEIDRAAGQRAVGGMTNVR